MCIRDRFLTLPKPKTVYELKKVDKYYYIDTFGTACSDIWDNDEIDNGRREIGNCFLTKEDAEFEVERRKIEAILLKYGKKVKSSQNEEYFILYDFVDKKVAIYPLSLIHIYKINDHPKWCDVKRMGK